MSEGAKLRCGVAGVGYLGQHHARIYEALDTCELAGVYEIDDARAAEICEARGCPRFESLEAMGAACDAVSVVVPTDRHHEVALPLLEAGCHLLIEKPLCASLAQAESILAAARRHDRLVQVGHIEHYNPVMGFLEQTVEDPRFITADRLAPFNPRGTEVGVVLDLMIHDIGVVLQLVRAPVERVEAIGVDVLSASEDIANARITFANGAVANLNTSRVSLKKVREIRVFQPRTYLSLDFMNQKGHLVRTESGNLKMEDIPIDKGEPLKIEIASFIESVARHAQPKVSGTLGRSALELAIRITEQIREGLEKARAAQHP
ncbi:MAG: Gfo/Idh/MocA family protein [Opitutales bacterium]